MIETHMRRVLGVIFDVDGVLCESEPFIRRAAMQMFKELYGVEVPAEDFRPFFGTGEARFIGGPAEKHGLDIDLDKAKSRTHKIYLRLIRGRLKPVIGAPEFIDWCRGLGLKLAAATSADVVKMRGNFREIGLSRELFDAAVTGEEIARNKPAPDIFELAASRLGLRPNECLAVEDAVTGVRAAKSAGCKCLGLTTTFSEGELLAAGADWVAPDFASVPEGVLMW